MASFKEHYRPNEDEERNLVEGRPCEDGVGREPRGVQSTIADADKKVRSGTTHESVRNTPPAGKWNDTTYD